MPRTTATRCLALLLLIPTGNLLAAQVQDRKALESPAASTTDSAPRRIHLILKDGSYQLVLSYKVDHDIVHFRSAERNGDTEDIPLSLVDIPATKKWIADHSRPDPNSQTRPVLSPELAKEEADRAARTPEVVPDLRLPEEDSILVLDTYQGAPELVPLEQEGGDLNKETAHNVLKQEINPASTAHRILDIRGDKADVQVHIPQPTFYIRMGTDDEGDPGGSAFTVDTHGASAGRPTPSGGADSSGYVIERLDMRSDIRTVDSFRISLLGVKSQPDVIEMKSEDVPGGHWMKLTPVHPLDFGEYALIEVLSDHAVNLGVWDFGVHPDAPEDVEAIRPQSRRPATLERRRPD